MGIRKDIKRLSELVSPYDGAEIKALREICKELKEENQTQANLIKTHLETIIRLDQENKDLIDNLAEVKLNANDEYVRLNKDIKRITDYNLVWTGKYTEINNSNIKLNKENEILKKAAKYISNYCIPQKCECVLCEALKEIEGLK